MVKLEELSLELLHTLPLRHCRFSLLSQRALSLHLHTGAGGEQLSHDGVLWVEF